MRTLRSSLLHLEVRWLSSNVGQLFKLHFALVPVLIAAPFRSLLVLLDSLVTLQPDFATKQPNRRMPTACLCSAQVCGQYDGLVRQQVVFRWKAPQHS